MTEQRVCANCLILSQLDWKKLADGMGTEPGRVSERIGPVRQSIIRECCEVLHCVG